MTATQPLAAAALGGVLAVALAAPASAQTKLPDDVKRTCTVKESAFANWFESGAVSKNGPVKPADSVDFKSAFAPSGKATNCDFYKWASRMFLWLTSPKDGDYVLNSPAIFTVSAPTDGGSRHFIRNRAHGPMQLAMRSEKVDDIGEIGQAGGRGVLMSQDWSFVYYGIHTNDAYAYFRTGKHHNAFPNPGLFSFRYEPA